MNAYARSEPPAVAAASPAAASLCFHPIPGDTTDFSSPVPGYWPDVPPAQWNDWKWQLKNRVTTLEQLERHLVLTPDERAGVVVAGSKLSLAVTPHFFNLIERDNPDCPIRRQVIPQIGESYVSPFEMADPCGEDSHMPVPGLVHRYPDRVLFLVTDRCASYCRYCTRSRVVSGAGDQELHTNFEEAIQLHRHTPGSPRRAALGRRPAAVFGRQARNAPEPPARHPARGIPAHRLARADLPAAAHHAGTLRDAGEVSSAVDERPRQPPARVDAGGQGGARTPRQRGIPLGNQSVLLRGVNDTVETMRPRPQAPALPGASVLPVQLDLIQGSSHLQVPVSKGLEIIEGLRGHTTGYAIPQYVIDAPGGGGKVPVNPNYVIYHDAEKVVIRNYEGKVFEYPEPALIP